MRKLSACIIMYFVLFLANASAQVLKAARSQSESRRLQAEIEAMLYFGLENPGDVPALFAEKILPVEHPLASCVVFPQHRNEAYWAEKADGAQGRGKILFMRMEGKQWTAPALAPFSGVYDDGFPGFAWDERRLYFLSDRPLAPAGEAGKVNLWFVERQGLEWSDPQPMDSVINKMEIKGQFWLNRDHHLFFASNAGNADGNFDIFWSACTGPRHLEPQRLSDRVNTAADETNAYVSPDGKTLIFARSTGEKSGSHLWVSYLNQADGTWSQAVPISDGVDVEGEERAGMISTDGLNLFFLGTRDGASGLYWRGADLVKKIKWKTVWYD